MRIGDRHLLPGSPSPTSLYVEHCRIAQHRGAPWLEFTDTVHAVRELSAWVGERFPLHCGHAKYLEEAANGPAVISAVRCIGGLIAVDPSIVGRPQAARALEQ